jgi:hypothetical protein
MNMTKPPTTPFVESIRWLEARCGSVPAGWQLAYNDMLCRLMAADCPARADIVVRGPFMDDLNLRVTQSAFDPVVAGILRRLERATAQTCEGCGRPAKLRCLDRTGVRSRAERRRAPGASTAGHSSDCHGRSGCTAQLGRGNARTGTGALEHPRTPRLKTEAAVLDGRVPEMPH